MKILAGYRKVMNNGLLMQKMILQLIMTFGRYYRVMKLFLEHTIMLKIIDQYFI